MNTKSNYSPDQVSYILENSSKISQEEMAKHLKVKKDTLNHFICLLRKKGHEIRVLRKGVLFPKKVGDEYIKTIKGIKYLKRWDGAKWQMVERITPYQEIKPRKPKKKKIMTKVVKQGKHKAWTASAPPPKKQEVKMPTRKVDESSMRYVRVNSKTLIQVKKDIPEETAILAWQNKRNYQQNHVNR